MAKAGADTAAATGKTFSEDTVAIILMALGTTSISTTQYNMMSAMDGQKTAAAFQHHFRSVLQKAKELKQRVDNGESFTAVQPPKKRGTSSLMTCLLAITDVRPGATAVDNMTPPVTPKKPKATPKPRKKKTKVDVSESENPTNDVNGGDASPGEFHVKREDELELDELNWDEV